MKNIHFIPHTHWDREWYRSSDAFRIRLVYSLDKLIDTLVNDPNFSFYTLDGQTCIVEEYLEIRPQNRELIERLIKDKKLLIGPWYTQPDLYLAQGESILRNLVLGSNYAEALGGCMNVGWVPDAFGQPQSLPQIFKALGMEAMFVWRGFNYRELDDSVFLWQAPNGDVLRSVHFPLGYGHYRYLPEEIDKALEDTNNVIEQLEPRFHEDQLLFMGGSDHARIQPEVPKILEALNDKLSPNYQLTISNPEKFIAESTAAIEKSGRELTVYKGEARSADLGRIHAGISSTNIDFKNAMKHFETLLARVVEPMSVMTHALGGSFDQGLTNYFWKQVFRNQFHDTIYQSSPETVNHSAYHRLTKLRHGINELIWLNFRFLRDTIDFSSVNEQEDVIIAFNTLSQKREDSMMINLFVKNPVFSLFTLDGDEVPYSVVENKTAINNEIEYYNGLLNLNDVADEREGTQHQVQILVSAEQVPSLGFKAYKVVYGQKPSAKLASTDLYCTESNFGNSKLDVMINEDGSLNVTNKVNGQSYRDVLVFEDKGDEGDEYNYSPPAEDQVFTTRGGLARVNVLENNTHRVSIEIAHSLALPLEVVDSKRSSQKVPVDIVSVVSLERGSSSLKVESTIDNTVNDHMMRVLLPHAEVSEHNLSEDHFTAIERTNRILNAKPLSEGATELELPIYPMQRFVTLANTQHTAAFVSAGPAEYEVYDNQTIALTLLRCVGMLGKADLTVRPGRASGYKLETPSSQLNGKSVSSTYALVFESGQPNVDVLSLHADRLNVDVQTRHLKCFSRQQNKSVSGTYQLNDISNVELLAIKRPENSADYTIFRLVNRAEENKEVSLPGQGNWFECSLKEVIGKPLENHVTIPAQSFITLAWKNV